NSAIASDAGYHYRRHRDVSMGSHVQKIVKEMVKLQRKIHWLNVQEKVYLRFSCNTGGDMGMNMVTKGVHTVIEYLTYDFPYMDVIGIFVWLSWWSSICSINSHASNIVFDEFIATCQDPAQNIESSQCITMMVAINVSGWDSEIRNTVSVSIDLVKPPMLLARELSLISAIAAGQLISSHMKYNKIHQRHLWNNDMDGNNVI
ncbi:hypothetical protein HID58_044775, partial [Brassica napus]